MSEYAVRCDSDTSGGESSRKLNDVIEPDMEMQSKARSCSPSSSEPSIAKPLAAWEEYTKGIGSKIMLKMGYVAGRGLGRNKDGRVSIVETKVAPRKVSLDNYSKLVEDEARRESERISRLTGNSAKIFETPKNISIDWETFNPTREQYQKAARIFGIPSCVVELSKVKKRALRLAMRSMIEKALPNLKSAHGDADKLSKNDEKSSKNEGTSPKNDEISPKREEKLLKNDEMLPKNGEICPSSSSSPGPAMAKIISGGLPDQTGGSKTTKEQRRKLRMERRAAALFLDRLLDESLKSRAATNGVDLKRRDLEESEAAAAKGSKRRRRRAGGTASDNAGKKIKLDDSSSCFGSRGSNGFEPRMLDSNEDDRLYRIAIVDDVDPRGCVRSRDADDVLRALLRYLDKTGPDAGSGAGTGPDAGPAPRFERGEYANNRLEFDCVGWRTVDFVTLVVLSCEDLWQRALFRLVDLTASVSNDMEDRSDFTELSVWLPGNPDETRVILKRFQVQNPGLRPLMWQVRRKNKQPPRGQSILLGVDQTSTNTLKRCNMRAFYGLGVVEFVEPIRPADCSRSILRDFVQK